MDFPMFRNAIIGITLSAVLGFAQATFGPVGIVATLGGCLAYLFALGLFASGRRDHAN